MPHPVLAKIDGERPDFIRTMIRRTSDGDSECYLQLWLPVQLDNGGWVAAVTITDLELPSISAMPGEDPLDALLKALAFARDVIERENGKFLFGDRRREGGALPLSLDRGFSVSRLAEIEAQAMQIADEAGEAMHAELLPSP